MSKSHHETNAAAVASLENDSGWHDYVVRGGKVRIAGHLASLAAQADPALWFDPAYAPLQATPVQAGGRQAAWFVKGPWQSAVLRHYRRGGLVARISRQYYIWQGERRSRAFSEFALLDAMFRQGLPVPQPLGAACWRSGVIYRAALVVTRIPDVRTLAQSLDSADPQAIAAAILKMHDAGVWHADLNAFNILLDEAGQVWLIDFDRGRVRDMAPRLRNANLARLRRSLCKVSPAGGAFAQRIEDAYRQLSSV